jgi:hypothetical protein
MERAHGHLVVCVDVEAWPEHSAHSTRVVASICYVFSTRMPQPSACRVCGHPVFNAKNHDVPAPRAAKMFPAMICKCGKPARVRCFNGVGTYWVECEDGHGRGRPA